MRTRRRNRTKQELGWSRLAIQAFLVVRPWSRTSSIECGVGLSANEVRYSIGQLIERGKLLRQGTERVPIYDVSFRHSERDPEHHTLGESMVWIRPEIVFQWDRAKNFSINLEDMPLLSKAQVWWRCHRDPNHQWQASLRYRVPWQPDCPTCDKGRQQKALLEAAQLRDLLAEFHPSKNGELRLDQISLDDSRQVWWRCSLNSEHFWKASLAARRRGRDCCPMCSGRSVVYPTSISSLFPDIAAEWHPSRNQGRSPDTVEANSKQAAWWQCRESPEHVWQATPYSRTVKGVGCLFCDDERVTVSESLLGRFPKVAAEWHPYKNGARCPDEIRPDSRLRAAWQCLKDPKHSWRESVQHRTESGSGCPYCGISRSTRSTLLRSSYPDLAAEWHPFKNPTAIPWSVRVDSEDAAWWRCKSHLSHVWEATIADRIKTPICPFCAEREQALRRKRSYVV